MWLRLCNQQTLSADALHTDYCHSLCGQKLPSFAAWHLFVERMAAETKTVHRQRPCFDTIQPQGIRKYKMRLAARVTKLELLSSWRHMWSLSAKSVIVIPFECIAKWSGKLSQLLSGSKISPESNQNLVQSPLTHLWLHWQCLNHQISTSSHNQLSSLRRENGKCPTSTQRAAPSVLSRDRRTPNKYSYTHDGRSCSKNQPRLAPNSMRQAFKWWSARMMLSWCISFSGSCIEFHHAWQTHGCVLAFERCISACTYVSHLICLPWLWPAVLHFVDCCPEAVPYMMCLCSDHPLPDIVMAGARVFVQCFHALIWDLPWCGTGIFTQSGQWDNRPIADRVIQAQLL